MATYKVLQDIEAEDKLVGPLSLRQFIYAGISVISMFIAFKLSFVSIFLVAPFLPIIILFAVLALPFGHDQPSEVWLLAKIKFYVKPHKRIWNKDGNNNLVTITVPKTVKKQLTKNFTQGEAQSRLQALANTIDSRGWAIKNINQNLNLDTGQIVVPDSTDRLVDIASLPQPVQQADVSASDDIMDVNNNSVAQHLNQMVKESREVGKSKAVASLATPPPTNHTNSPQANSNSPDYWFLNDQSKTTMPSGYTKFDDDSVIRPFSDDNFVTAAQETEADKELEKKIEISKKKSDLVNSHLHTIQPIDKTKKDRPTVSIKRPATKVTPQSNPDILNLALANKDNWSVATIASQAEKAKRKEPPQDEVVVSLH